MVSISSFSQPASVGSAEDERAITSMLSRLEKAGQPIKEPDKTPLLMKAIDILSRPGYATTGALRALLRGQDVGKAAVKGITGEKKTTFRDVLEKDLGVKNIPIPYFPDTNTILGLAGDIVLDPTTYLSFGTAGGATAIGKAGAKKFLTKAGEEALTTRAVDLVERLTKRAAGRASPAALERAAKRLAEDTLLSKAGTAAGKKLFDEGGMKIAGKTVISTDAAKKAAHQIVDLGRRAPVFGKVIDYSQNALDVVKDVAGYTFKPGYKFQKIAGQLTENLKRTASTMGMTTEEAAKVFPELSQELQSALADVSKSKRFMAQQGYKQMVDMFAGINPEEGKILAQAMENVPGSFEKLSENGKHAYTAVKTLIEDVGPQQVKYGFINRLAKNFTPRYLSPEAKQYLVENAGATDPAVAGLIKIFSVKKGKERVLITKATKDTLIEQAGNNAASEVIENGIKKTQETITRLENRILKKTSTAVDRVVDTVEKEKTIRFQKILRQAEEQKNKMARALVRKGGKVPDVIPMTDDDVLKLTAVKEAAEKEVQKTINELETFMTKKVTMAEARGFKAMGKKREKIIADMQQSIIEKSTKAEEIAMKLRKHQLESKFSSEFFGKPVVKNTIEELNAISKEKLGFNWFEEDLTKALPRYYSDFVTNKAVFDGLQNLPRTVNNESGWQIFKPVASDGKLYPGHTQFTLDALKGYQAPKFLVDQVEDTYKILTNEEALNKFIKAYDKGMRLFKFGVTVPFPAFHTQNFLGGQFAGFEYGLTPGTPEWMKRMTQARSMIEQVPWEKTPGKISNTVGEGAVKDMTWQQMRELYERYGVSGGMFHGDVGESVYRKVFAAKEPMVRKGMAKLMDAGSNLGGFIEDLNRMPIFINEMVKHGDPARAAKTVFKYQFDYAPEAYTYVEREVFSRLLPFYKFMRGNIPLQLNTLYNKTGKVNAILKGIRDLGGGEDVDKPEYLRSQFSIKMPPEIAKIFGAKYGDKIFMSLPFPLAELGKLEPKTLLSAMTPIIRVPAELATNQQFFFGNHIWNPDLPAYAQTSKAYPILKPLIDLPGGIGDGIAKAIKWREKPLVDASGNPTGSVYYEADSKLMYGLKQMLGPISRAYILFGQMPDAGTAQNLSEMVLPFGITSVNEQEAQVSRLSQSRRELTQLVGYLKARGLVPEAGKGKKLLPSQISTQEGSKYMQELMGTE